MNIKGFAIEAISGCILWTILLTPYMIFITKLTIEQYISWIIMEMILIIPLAPIVYRLTSFIKRKILGDVE